VAFKSLNLIVEEGLLGIENQTQLGRGWIEEEKRVDGEDQCIMQCSYRNITGIPPIFTISMYQ
jgi:hypothetical protein